MSELVPPVPLLGRLTRLQQYQAGYRTPIYVIRHDWWQMVSWVSRSPRVAAFMRDWFTGWDAGGLYGL